MGHHYAVVLSGIFRLLTPVILNLLVPELERQKGHLKIMVRLSYSIKSLIQWIM